MADTEINEAVNNTKDGAINQRELDWLRTWVRSLVRATLLEAKRCKTLRNMD